MMGEELNIEDQEVLEKFENIDWVRLGMEDAGAFGLGVTFYREALDVHLRLQSNARENTFVFLGIIVILVVCSLMKLGMGAILAAIVSLKCLSLVYAWFRERAAAGAVKVQLDSLKDNLTQLEAKFPVPHFDDEDEDDVPTDPASPLS